MKSEVGEDNIEAGIFLKKKAYALKVSINEEKEKIEKSQEMAETMKEKCIREIIKLKGVGKSFMKDCSFETYRDTMFKDKIDRVVVHLMKSIDLQMFNVMQERLRLTPLSESRFLLPPHGVESFAFGHFAIGKGRRETVLEEPE